MIKEEKEPIRVLHVLAGMNRAGIETLLMRLYRCIDRKKIQFDFAVFMENKCDYDEEIIKLGGKIIHYPHYNGINHFSYVAWWDFFIREHTEYRIVHGHIPGTATIYLKIAKKYGRYAIAHSHNVTRTGRVSFRTALLRIWGYPTRHIADYFFGCSRKAIVDRYGLKIADNPDRSMIFKNAIDIDNYIFNEQIRREVRAEFKLNPTVITVGTVGRLCIQKNVFGIIEIADELRKRKIDYKLLWCGRGELENKVKDEITKRGLEENVIMLGSRSDVERLLQGMDVFIFPSLWEGLGIAAIEAQAAGLPTLCSNKIPREVQVTKLCQMLSLNDYEKWANIIEEMGNIERENMKEVILSAGYDIKEMAIWLQSFYLSKIIGEV